MLEEREVSQSRFWPLAFFGVSSVIFAEVFSGSSPLWFINGGFILVLPLYSTHAILLFNLALRFKRTNLTQLYLWGVIFGLYESWITKVILAGYMNEPGPGMGTFLGFAIPEFFVIALFWHAVFSFIVPVLVYEILASSAGNNPGDGIIQSHIAFITDRRRNVVLFGLVFLVGASFLNGGLGDIEAVLVSAVGNTAIILLLAYLAKTRSSGTLSIESLRLGDRGMGIAATVLLVQYVLLSILLLPERFPGLLTILLTIGFYGVVVTLIFASPKDSEPTMIEEDARILGWNFIQKMFGVFIIIGLIWSLMVGLVMLLFIMFYLAIIVIGPVLFLRAMYKVIMLRLQRR